MLLEHKQPLSPGPELCAEKRSVDGARGDDHASLRQLVREALRTPGGPGQGPRDYDPLSVRVELRGSARAAGGALADVVASSVVADVERRQDLLCELNVGARLRAVLAEVSEVLARLAPVKPDGPVN